MNIEDKIHLEFIHNRLIDVYGENRNTDFVKRLRDIINGETKGQELPIQNVSVSLPTKAEAVSEGYRIANEAGYNYRRVLKEPDDDIYYSGWMDCFDWMSKGNER